MKKAFSVLLLFTAVAVHLTACAQGGDKSKRPSPPATVSQTLKSGATITINYSQPSLKGRTIGKDVEPKEGEVWRTGANEATTFEVSKDVKVEGQALPAGKYAFFTLSKGGDVTLIFNKVWDTWGAFDYGKNKDQDALNVKVKAGTNSSSVEKLTYTIDKNGKVSLMWGTMKYEFSVQ